MDKEPERYDVKFHLPYASVTVTNVLGWQVEGWKSYLRNNKAFEVQEGAREYVINPAMVTYMEISKHLLF